MSAAHLFNTEPKLSKFVSKNEVKKQLTQSMNHIQRPMRPDEMLRRDVPQVWEHATNQGYYRNDAPFCNTGNYDITGKPVSSELSYATVSKFQKVKPFAALVPKPFLSVHY